MRKLIIMFIISSFLLNSCDSAKKAFQRGSYDAAFAMATKKLQKKPYDEEHAKIFVLSYQKANQKDIDRIEYLKKSKEMQVWSEILKLYKKLAKRQELAETVLPLRAGGKTVNFEHINYDENIIEAKNSAAYYHYNEGVRLMSGDKKDARKAYDHFVTVRSYTNNYDDLEQRIREAEAKGTIKIMLLSTNNSFIILPERFMRDLTNISTQEIDDKWRKYYNTAVKTNFDYNAIIVVNSIDISPNNVEEDKRIVRKEVRDGWEYELDTRGNVRKDSLGNDIKKPKYKVISCTITTKEQSKTAEISVSVDIQDNRTGKIVASTPIKANSTFNYTYSQADGDLQALDSELRNTVGKLSKPFPNDDEMLEDLKYDLRKEIIDALINSKKFVL